MRFVNYWLLVGIWFIGDLRCSRSVRTLVKVGPDLKKLVRTCKTEEKTSFRFAYKILSSLRQQSSLCPSRQMNSLILTICGTENRNLDSAYRGVFFHQYEMDNCWNFWSCNLVGWFLLLELSWLLNESVSKRIQNVEDLDCSTISICFYYLIKGETLFYVFFL